MKQEAFCWLTVSAVALMAHERRAGAGRTATTTDPRRPPRRSPVDHSNEIVVAAERRSTSLQRTGVAPPRC